MVVLASVPNSNEWAAILAAGTALLAGAVPLILRSFQRSSDQAEVRYRNDLVRRFEAALTDDVGLTDSVAIQLIRPGTPPKTEHVATPPKGSHQTAPTVPKTSAEEDAERRMASLPVEYHAQVLAQSRTSFAFSIGAALVGFLILAVAIVLVLTGHVKPGLATMVGSVIAEAVPALFFTQSNRARKLMAGQLEGFRTDAETSRQARERRDLIELVSDPVARDNLISETVLVLAKRPLPVPPQELPGRDDRSRDTVRR